MAQASLDLSMLTEDDATETHVDNHVGITWVWFHAVDKWGSRHPVAGFRIVGVRTRLCARTALTSAKDTKSFALAWARVSVFLDKNEHLVCVDF